MVKNVTVSSRPWQFEGPPLVLVEHDDPEAGQALARALRLEGYDVALCRGPEALADPATGLSPRRRGLAFHGVFSSVDPVCPVREGDSCLAVERADVVVSALGREGTDALRQRYPETPLVVVQADAASEQVLREVRRALAA